VSRVQSEVGSLKGKFVAILGATYRSGVKETAFSGVYELNEALNNFDANVQVHDFILTNEEIENLQLQPATTLEKVEIAIVHHHDPRYIGFLQNRDLFPKLQFIFDGRNVLSGTTFPKNITVISL
jgi:UDP-glucose 6-dehydrogenase